MRKPNKQQLEDYAEEIGFKEFDAQEFLDHYDSNGWMVGRVAMVDWKATVRTWRRMRHAFKRDRHQPVKTTWRERQDKINKLNRHKADLMRQPRSPQRDRELARISAELHKL